MATGVAAGAASGAASGFASGLAGGPMTGAVGAIGGAAIGAFSANAQSKKSYKYASRLQKQAAKLNYQYSLKSAENLPTSTRTGLENAGYNPMLAVQNSTQGANSSWTSATKADVADMGSAISAGVANAQSVQRLKNETQVAETQAKTNEATAENQSAQAMNNLEENKYIGDKRKAEISNLQGNTMLMEAQIDNLEKQIELGYAGLTVQQSANAIQEERNRIIRETSPSGRSQSFRNYMSGTRDLFSGIGDVIHGRNDNYEYYTDTREVTNGPKGRSTEKVTSKRSGKRKRR